MKAIYGNTCWYCAREELEDMGSYVRCKHCGATWNHIPKLGPKVFTGQGYRVSQGLDSFKPDNPFIPTTE